MGLGGQVEAKMAAEVAFGSVRSVFGSHKRASKAIRSPQELKRPTTRIPERSGELARGGSGLAAPRRPRRHIGEH